MSKPLAIDLFCGLGGWAEGFLAEGYDVIGFDIERHDYGNGGYPGQLVLQDVLTLDGRQFRNAAVIVASPPCQFFSRMAMPFRMPWKQPEYERRRELSHALFRACWRIQQEASEAAGKHIPLLIENVRGAQPWIGTASWKYGSFYLWGDIPALMPSMSARKNTGGSWFGQRDGKPLERNDPRDMRRIPDGTKMGGGWWHDSTNDLIRKCSSRSTARKAASAQIAKIPFPLAQHIAKVFKLDPAATPLEVRS